MMVLGVNRAHPYLPSKDAAMDQHIDALYRISHTAPPAASTQALMLLFQLAVGSGEQATQSVENINAKRNSASKEEDGDVVRKDRFYRALYSKLGVNEMFSGRQLTLFFNLLYKAMKYDTCTERICSFAKRLMHSVLHESQSIICGTLFLLSEIGKCHPEILATGSSSGGGVSPFDPTKREPSAAFDGKAASLSQTLWELSLLSHHFHPSVSKFATSREEINYAGDPLKDFSLAPFLDKFAFRNPKSVKAKKEGIAAGRKTASEKIMGLPMNDPSHLQAETIPAEERFFHQFFVERAKRDEIKGIVRGSADTKDRDGDEDDALDAAEKMADDVSYASCLLYSKQPLCDFLFTPSLIYVSHQDFDWSDVDPEEEEFATQLAEKLMESSGHGKANFDDEDPDMDAWSDFDSDEESKQDLEAASDTDEGVDAINQEDAFMDAEDSSDDEGRQLMEEINASDDSDSFEGFRMIDGSDDDDDDAPSIEEDRSTKKQHSKQPKGQKRKKVEVSIYADAEDYEKVIKRR